MNWSGVVATGVGRQSFADDVLYVYGVLLILISGFLLSILRQSACSAQAEPSDWSRNFGEAILHNYNS